jgi:hypothetical protein
MGGNQTTGLNKQYCIRGLERYQSLALNAEMHSHRLMRHQTALKEQRRQRRAGAGAGGISDAVRMQQSVNRMSVWALRRA